MYDAVLRWTGELDPTRFIEKGEEPNLGYEPLAPAPDMVFRAAVLGVAHSGGGEWPRCIVDRWGRLYRLARGGDLIAMGHRVVVLDDLSGGFVDNVVRRPSSSRAAIDDGPGRWPVRRDPFDYVFHLAAYAAEGLSHFIKRFNYTNNLFGSVNLFNASINHGVSSALCSPLPSRSMAAARAAHDRRRPADPEDPYGIAKLAVEQDLRVCTEMFDLDYIIFRPHNVYGERQNIADQYRNVVGIFMNQILQDKPMTVFGDGGQSRAFSHISDVAPIIARSIEVPEAYDQIFNVGADQPYTVNELACAVARAMGDPNVNHLEARNEVKLGLLRSQQTGRGLWQAGQGPSLEKGIRLMADSGQIARGPREQHL